MVDNWFMEEVIADINAQRTHCSSYYAELLMSIVLWDEVYYPLNQYNWWNSVPSQVKDTLIPIEDFKEEGKYESIKELYRYKGVSEEEFYWLKWKEQTLLDPEDTINSGAIRYLALSNKYGLNYLPCAKRHKFLQEYCSKNNMNILLSRIKLQDNLTKTIEEYYTETYKALLDFSNLEIKMPILVNYIIDNSTDNMTPVDFAFHLKNEGNVVRYREYLNSIENSLEHQNWKELRNLLLYSEDAVNSVISMDKKRLNGITVGILPVPSIIFKHKNITTTISSKPSLTIENFEKSFKKFNLTFLKDITKYAINDMRRW